jgi:hypothetical protein
MSAATPQRLQERWKPRKADARPGIRWTPAKPPHPLHPQTRGSAHSQRNLYICSSCCLRILTGAITPGEPSQLSSTSRPRGMRRVARTWPGGREGSGRREAGGKGAVERRFGRSLEREHRRGRCAVAARTHRRTHCTAHTVRRPVLLIRATGRSCCLRGSPAVQPPQGPSHSAARPPRAPHGPHLRTNRHLPYSAISPTAPALSHARPSRESVTQSHSSSKSKTTRPACSPDATHHHAVVLQHRHRVGRAGMVGQRHLRPDACGGGQRLRPARRSPYTES